MLLSSFDTVGLFAMAVCMFISGVLGDIYNPRYMITSAFLVMSIASGLFGLVGMY